MIKVKTLRLFEKDLSQAAALINNGQIVAFPTDTVYGLGANATDDSAVKAVFAAKGRPADRPLNVLVANKGALEDYATDVAAAAKKLADKFWPGPLTIILNKKNQFAPSVTGGLDTIGLRMPDHPLALEFIEKCGVPLAAPSANSSGRPSPTTADHVLDDLEGKIPAIIDGGETAFGIESTVLDFSKPERPVILRPGGVTKEAIEEVIGYAVYTLNDIEKTSDQINKSVNAKHYEPGIPVYMVKSEWEDAVSQMAKKNEQIGLLANDELISKFEDRAVAVFSLGRTKDIQIANQRFFKGLRTLENSPATVILAETFPMDEDSAAYMNRLESAANGKEL